MRERKRVTASFFWLLVVAFLVKLHAHANVSEGSIKELIVAKQQQIKALQKQDQGELQKDLAILYLEDQDQERAFEMFIHSLENVQPKASSLACDDKMYQDALALYLNPQSETPQKTATQIIERFSCAANSQESPLNYLVALAYANLGRYDEFFKLFYSTYIHDPESYLADKTKAILHIKLLERSPVAEKKEALRLLIKTHLMRAETKEPRDFSLYKLQITFSSQEEKRETLSRCLNKIIQSNIIVPRSEIQFYVQHAVDASQKDLAQRFIDKTRQWYPCSRIIDTAQKFLDSSF